MLSRVYIQNVRSCADIELRDLGLMTVLVGRNGAGKTNILRTIEEAAKTAVGQGDFLLNFSPLFPTGTASAPESAVEFEFAADDHQFKYRQTNHLYQSRPQAGANRAAPAWNVELSERLEYRTSDMLQGSAWRLIFERKGELIRIGDGTTELQIAARAAALPAILSLLPKEDDRLRVLQPVLNFLSSIHYYPLDEPNLMAVGGSSDFVRQGDYLQWLKTRNIANYSTVVMRLIHMSLEKREQFDLLKHLLGKNGLDIISDIEVHQLPIANQAPKPTDPANTFYYPLFKPSHSREKDWKPYSQMSFGTRRLLRIVASLLHDDSKVALIEQPEDGIHPGLLHKIIPLMKSNLDSSQILMSSHAPAVFNRLEPQEIRIVEMDQGITQLRPLNSKEIEGARKFMMEDGPLADFIEGITGD